MGRGRGEGCGGKVGNGGFSQVLRDTTDFISFVSIFTNTGYAFVFFYLH